MAAGNYWMSQMNPDISPGQAVWPRVVLIVGLAMCFAPQMWRLTSYTPITLRGSAVGLLSLLRNESGSVGTSLAQTMRERRDQFHSLRLGEWPDPFNAGARAFLGQASGPFLQQTGDPVVVATRFAGPGEPAPATGIGARLLRCLLGAGRCHGRADVYCVAYEAIRSRERPRVGSE